ncbi:hypothetical protein D3C80_1687960 [compost metagenome]
MYLRIRPPALQSLCNLFLQPKEPALRKQRQTSQLNRPLLHYPLHFVQFTGEDCYSQLLQLRFKGVVFHRSTLFESLTVQVNPSFPLQQIPLVQSLPCLMKSRFQPLRQSTRITESNIHLHPIGLLNRLVDPVH